MKVFAIGILLLQVFWICGCSSTKQVRNDISTTIEKPNDQDLKALNGKKITVTGKTVNAKLGAILILESGTYIWMDKMESWPSGYYVYENDKETKTVEVTGVLIERHDLPVFIPNEDNSNIQQGIPKPQGTDLKEASHRYLLKDYEWKEIK